MKAFRTYKGVKIFRVKDEIAGSSFSVHNNGSIVDKKPEYDISFQYNDSYPYDTVEEVKQSIDNIWNNAGWEKSQLKEFADIMNGVT
jgi:hypothetical protein